MAQARLLAILLTDLSGFTEFTSHADHRGVMEAVQKQKAIIEPTIRLHGGRIVKWIGDAALAVFETATDAVLCGRKIQEQFLTEGERGQARLPSLVKVVVHLGDIAVDTDGDIYGDAVNTLARMEKVAQPDEVYFSSTVRESIPRSEVSSEFVGDFEFKGLPDKIKVYRSCFGQTPIVRERTIFVQTNFVHVNQLADELGWDVVHPAFDDITAAIIAATRKHGGTNRGVMQTGCFLTFETVERALAAAVEWQDGIERVRHRHKRDDIAVRTAIHRGTLHLMRYTLMGEDIDVVRTLAALGFGDDILITGAALNSIVELNGKTMFREESAQNLRDCNSRKRWAEKFSSITVYRSDLQAASH